MDPLIAGATIPTTITNHIVFTAPFSTPPKVVVWLTGLSATTGAAVSVNVTANDITEAGFVLQISSGDGARLQSVGTAWAVWAENGEHQSSPITVDCLNTLTPGKQRVTLFRNPETLVDGTAIVMVAVSAVDLVLVENLWVAVSAFPGGGGSAWIVAVEPSVANVSSVGAAHVSR